MPENSTKEFRGKSGLWLSINKINSASDVGLSHGGSLPKQTASWKEPAGTWTWPSAGRARSKDVAEGSSRPQPRAHWPDEVRVSPSLGPRSSAQALGPWRHGTWGITTTSPRGERPSLLQDLSSFLFLSSSWTWTQCSTALGRGGELYAHGVRSPATRVIAPNTSPAGHTRPRPFVGPDTSPLLGPPKGSSRSSLVSQVRGKSLPGTVPGAGEASVSLLSQRLQLRG